MESGAHRFNLDLLGWPKLEERRLQTKLSLFQKARLNLIDIPTDHLAIKLRQSRQGGDGLTYHRLLHLQIFPKKIPNLEQYIPGIKEPCSLDTFMTAVSSVNPEEIMSGIDLY